MRQKSNTNAQSSEQIVNGIRRATRKRYSAEEKIRIVLDGLRGEISIAELCRGEGIAEGLYYSWYKEFLEAGKRRLADDTARAATSDEVKISDARPGSSTRSSPSRRSSCACSKKVWPAPSASDLDRQSAPTYPV
jgi:transposase